MRFIPIIVIIGIVAILAYRPSKEIPFPYEPPKYAVACACGDCGIMIDKIEDLDGIITDWQCVGCGDVPIPVANDMFEHHMECSQITFAMYPAKYLALIGKLPTPREPAP